MALAAHPSARGSIRLEGPDGYALCLLPALLAPSEKGIPRIRRIVGSATGKWSLLTGYVYSCCTCICVFLTRI